MSEQCGKLNHIYAYEESEVVFGPYDGSWREQLFSRFSVYRPKSAEGDRMSIQSCR